MEVLWTIAAFVLTLMVLSYLLGDSPVFRFAIYLFIGVSAGYAASLLLRQVLWVKLITPLLTGTMDEKLLILVPLVLGAMLLTKISPRFGSLGNIPMAILVGTGAAVAVGGAVTGTIFGQFGAAIAPFDLSAVSGDGVDKLWQLFEGAFLLIGAAATLIYFQFGARSRPGLPPQRPGWIESISKIGQIFIGITLGALFSGVYLATLAALVDRIYFLAKTILSWIG